MDPIAKPLSYIFNKSLSQGIFPDIMKIAEVVPLHKSGNPHMIDNYRPISLLMTISKILEKLIYSCVYTFLDKSGQIYDSQYGFRSKHSCEHAISELVGNILKDKEKGDHTISVFLDLSKAFDTLECSTLFKKMEIYGIRGQALDWFHSYLTNREMLAKCTINNEIVCSNKHKVTYGAPQGSCLGPLLFLIFCNDLHLNLEFTKCILFADDVTLFYSNRNLSLLIASLEHDLSITNDWFKANKLTLNMKKSVCILFHANKSVTAPNSIQIDNTPIIFVNHTKFLGVWIDKDLTWTIHMDKVALKIKRNSHMLLRTKRQLSLHAKKILYFTQIYSHINYSISVWGPMTKSSQISKILSIQNKCLKCVQSNHSKFLCVGKIIDLEILKFGLKVKNQALPFSLQKCALTCAWGLSLVKNMGAALEIKHYPMFLESKINSTNQAFSAKVLLG